MICRTLSLGAAACLALPWAVTAGEKPNILVILADDLGYADIPGHAAKDLAMPNVEKLAREGVRFSNGYVTSPQCSPSRAGLLTGVYNQRFGHENNGCMQATFNAGAKTIADHLKPQGYATAAFGKWHLGDNLESHRPNRRGFDQFWGFNQYRKACQDGSLGFPGASPEPSAFHAQVFAAKAAEFIAAKADQPWFVYLALHEPHVDVIPTPESEALTRASADEPLRQKCLGVLRDIDECVGLVQAKLRELGIEKNTLVFFLSDNGAPVSMDGDGGESTADVAINGSRNEPLRGRKGLMWEGGIRVPFLMAWPGTLPEGKVYDFPVISLDIAATALAVAGASPVGDVKLDGVNLLPYLTGQKTGPPHERLFWRYADRNLSAMREGNWKLVQSHKTTAQLFDLDSDPGEQTDLSANHPDIVKRLQAAWDEWNATLKPPAYDPGAGKKKE
jgi:arylsulfatase A-like enzyme